MKIQRRTGNRRSWPVAISSGVLITSGVTVGAIGVFIGSLISLGGFVLIFLGCLVVEVEIVR